MGKAEHLQPGKQNVLTATGTFIIHILPSCAMHACMYVLLCAHRVPVLHAIDFDFVIMPDPLEGKEMMLFFGISFIPPVFDSLYNSVIHSAMMHVCIV